LNFHPSSPELKENLFSASLREKNRLLLQIHPLNRNKAVAKHVNRGLGLFQNDVANQWLVIAILGFHVEEKDFVVDRPESFDTNSNGPQIVP
jgi:hypothetical protein